jgi:hypothetical protein
MHEYPATDENPHKPGPERDWQESVVLIWWDPNNAVGGYFRVGHEPNHNGGETNIWATVHLPGESFFRNATLPLTPADRGSNKIGAGQGALDYSYDGQVCWNMKEKDIAVSLRLEDFHAAIDGYIKDGKPELGGVHTNHVEVAVRVTGTVTSRGKTWNIDGLGMRDHGWGPRNWGTVWGHRWSVGAFDRDNSFCAVTMLLAAEKIARFGWVVRGDKIIYADKIEIVAHMANDCVSNVGGRTLMVLTTGERFEVAFDPVAPAAAYYHHGVTCVDTLSRMSWGDRTGYGVFETSTNPQVGLHRPMTFDGGLGSDGWHKHGFGL